LGSPRTRITQSEIGHHADQAGPRRYYPAVAAQLIPDLGTILVQACGIGRGDRALDVAAGSGNAAILAALTGANVVALDLAPELLDAGQVRAAERGAQLEWRLGDAEDLPFADGELDVVMSCLGEAICLDPLIRETLLVAGFAT